MCGLLLRYLARFRPRHPNQGQRQAHRLLLWSFDEHPRTLTLTMASQPLRSLAHHLAEKLEFQKLWTNQRDILKKTYYLGFTCFGGPNVHFQIVRAK